MICGAVVLAAGPSTRLGRPKQLLAADGPSLLRHTVLAALGARCHPVVVVLGAGAERVRPEIADLDVRIVMNAGWSEGVGSSIRAGIDVLRAADPQAALLLVCDQPRVDAALLARLIAEFEAAPGCAVACAYAGTLGVPAVFPRERFAELAGLRGDRGAKALLLGMPDKLRTVRWPEGAFDIDTPDDAQRL